MDDDIMQAVLKHLVNELEETINLNDITAESNLRDDLDLNSLQAVNLIMEMEDEFDISISEEELVPIKTIGDVVTAIQEKLKQKGEG